jgi:hypothetical protein
MQTLTKEDLKDRLKYEIENRPKSRSDSYPPLCLKRQTHMHCVICDEVAESYSQKECHRCGSVFKWSISWKNGKYPCIYPPSTPT